VIPIKENLNKLQLEPTTEIEIDNEILVGYFNIKYREIIFPQKGVNFFPKNSIYFYEKVLRKF